jgi:hypothetical protein
MTIPEALEGREVSGLDRRKSGWVIRLSDGSGIWLSNTGEVEFRARESGGWRALAAYHE